MGHMRPEDLANLEKQYSGPNGSSDEAFAAAVGVDVAPLRALAAEIFGDLDDTHGLFGVGWWFPHPGTQRRIAISDYLLRVVESVGVNLVEARLHQLDSLAAFEAEDEFIARAVDYDNRGAIEVKMPPRTRPLDDLPRLLRDLQIAGFFRAIGSALDCLAAAVVGVLGMPERIQFADLGTVVKGLAKPIAANSPEAILWIPVRDALDRVGNQPHAGWLEWTLQYRNTLVHRARPISLLSLKPRPTLARAGHPVPHIRTSQVLMLARDPRRSDVEVLQDTRGPILTEDARSTMECILNSTIGLCEEVGGLLLDAWRQRRADPALLPQPAKQWPSYPSAAPSVFDGCSPGEEPYDPGQFTASPSIAKRMMAACLLDDASSAWHTFD